MSFALEIGSTTDNVGHPMHSQTRQRYVRQRTCPSPISCTRLADQLANVIMILNLMPQ